ncbi:hypothetical protein LY76DRAFT_591396 [Colletotrichum caudatum]|nr:hypothetical protein LY76DRAFT_591396 [Colletotrichum caudatum]
MISYDIPMGHSLDRYWIAAVALLYRAFCTVSRDWDVAHFSDVAYRVLRTMLLHMCRVNYTRPRVRIRSDHTNQYINRPSIDCAIRSPPLTLESSTLLHSLPATPSRLSVWLAILGAVLAMRIWLSSRSRAGHVEEPEEKQPTRRLNRKNDIILPSHVRPLQRNQSSIGGAPWADPLFVPSTRSFVRTRSKTLERPFSEWKPRGVADRRRKSSAKRCLITVRRAIIME